MKVRAELRDLLEEQVRAAKEAYEGALRAYEDARDALYASYTDLNAYRKALEAATRETNDPYLPPFLANPLDGPVVKPAEAPKPPPAIIMTPRVTKSSIILNTLAAANGKGMKTDDVLRAIPNDAPIEITKNDLYRALPRLAADNKLWRDKGGFYRYGPKPAEAESNEGFFEELEKE